ncbi:hypothetical protein PIB30_032694 [Stylosanthes scabra]|uniref:Uncharacterized protein n=1 Tax=Stylosanthes scabra TaxID=79078 RepID=A0ABU6QBU5_9FABA|nr:hypothetical protein [Stylosanthes scabra]
MRITSNENLIPPPLAIRTLELKLMMPCLFREGVKFGDIRLERSYTHKKADDATCADIAAAAAAKTQGDATQVGGDANNQGGAQILEIDITQPNYSQSLIIEERRLFQYQAQDRTWTQCKEQA